MSLPAFSFVAPLAAADGYGQSAERLALAATDLGADLAYISHDWVDDEHTDLELRRLLRNQAEIQSRPLVAVYFLPFAFTRFRSRVTVGMTMFETDSIPPFWAGPCNTTDGVVVPSEHCRQAFQSMLDVPVVVAPLGVDTTFYCPNPAPAARDAFTFLMTGALHYRKGAGFAVRAFLDEFGSEPDVRLVLKTRRGFLDVDDIPLDDPRITVIDASWSREQMRDLYWGCDCYIACSRGEAAGLTPREAMACGLPAIITNWGGLAEIAHPATGYVTGIDGLEPAPAECSSYGAGVAGRLPIGNFCRPSVSEIRQAMRAAYEQPEVNRLLGQQAAVAMRAWSWEKCAAKWLAVLGELWELATGEEAA